MPTCTSFRSRRNGRDALITAYYPVYRNESSVHGPKRGIVFDAVVQEIDIPTGLVIFQWDSLDHVPLTASYRPRRRRTAGIRTTTSTSTRSIRITTAT